MSKQMSKTLGKSIVATACFAVVMSAASAWADEGYLEIRNGALINAQPEFVAVSDGYGARTGGIAVGWEPGFMEGLRLMTSYDGDGFVAHRFDGDVGIEWARQRVMASADYGIDVIGDWIRPLARFGLGYARQSLVLATEDAAYRGVDHGVSATLAGGLEMFVGRDDFGGDMLAGFSLGLNFLAGYAWQSEATFDAMETTEDIDEDEDPWERATYDAGSFRASGFTWTIGAALRYDFGE